MDTVLLIDRHLVFFEIEIRVALLKGADHEVVRKLVLVGKTSSGDCLQPFQELDVCLMPLLNGCKRVVCQLVVVPIISEGGRALGEIAEIGLVLLVEEGVLSGKTLGDRLKILGKAHDRKKTQEKAAEAHSARKVIKSVLAIPESGSRGLSADFSANSAVTHLTAEIAEYSQRPLSKS